MHALKHWLYPSHLAPHVRGRAGLVAVTCLGIIAALALLLLTWLLSGDLEAETAIASAVLGLLLLGITALARSGRVRSALWLLIGLLTSLITANLAGFGLGSPSAAGYILPVLLAACGAGLLAGLSIAAGSAGLLWLFAWLTTSGRYALPYGTVDSSHLTFNALALTVMLLLSALIAGCAHYQPSE